MNTYGVAKLTILVVVVVMLYAVITIMTGCNPQSETDAFDGGYVIAEGHAQGVALEVGHDVIVVDLEYDGVYEESEGRMKWIPTEGS